jgi:hypothetical protein
MRALRFPMTVVAVSALLTTGAFAAQVAHASGGQAARSSHPTWRTAIEVPGTARLNAGGNDSVNSLSCPSAGNCVLGGNTNAKAFVASLRHGKWGKAFEVPGTAALTKGGGFARINAVSCASAGNCSAGGAFGNGPRTDFAPVVVSERHGIWRKAIRLPGTAKLGAFGFASVGAISCASPGNCAAGGSYHVSASATEAFVVSQRHGNWGKTVTVPGTSVLNTENDADAVSISCPSAGNCTAGGYYDTPAGSQPFLTVLHHGTWSKAIQLKGLSATGGMVESVSCPSAGNCVAGGEYTDMSGHLQAFVVSQRKGKWAKAVEVPGTAALNTGNSAGTYSVSCASAGNCAAAGGYFNTAGRQAWVATERKGKWAKAIEVPGFAALNSGEEGAAYSVSCGRPGFCAAGGDYRSGSDTEVFVVNERSGKWGKAIEVPGTGKLNVSGNANLSSVSCAGTSFCAAGGAYFDAKADDQAFVAEQR